MIDSPSENKNIILVDHFDNPIGLAEKLIVHQFGMLHRAFSVFIFYKNENEIELLLQQRNKNKYHCGSLWTNTCCSHPKLEENIIHAGERRLKEEMGIETSLSNLGSFHYIALFENGLIENEIDHVLVGYTNSKNVKPNPSEVENYKWIKPAYLMKDIKKNSKIYTPWLEKALNIIYPKNYI